MIILNNKRNILREVSSLCRAAMVLQNPGMSRNWKKKIPGPGKSLNLGCSP